MVLASEAGAGKSDLPYEHEHAHAHAHAHEHEHEQSAGNVHYNASTTRRFVITLGLPPLP